MPEEDVREMKRSQEVSEQWFDACTLVGYDYEWEGLLRSENFDTFYREPLDITYSINIHKGNPVDYFYTKEHQLTWWYYEFISEEVYDWYVDGISEEVGAASEFPSTGGYWDNCQDRGAHNPYDAVDEDGDEYPWTGIEQTTCIVPLPYRVRRPTKLAFFVKCLHQPTGASLCGDEFFALKDSLALHEMREFGDEEERIFLRFAIRRLRANIQTPRFAKQLAFSAHRIRASEVLQDFFCEHLPQVPPTEVPGCETPLFRTKSYWSDSEIDASRLRSVPYRGLLFNREFLELVEYLGPTISWGCPKTPPSTVVHSYTFYGILCSSVGFDTDFYRQV